MKLHVSMVYRNYYFLKCELGEMSLRQLIKLRKNEDRAFNMDEVRIIMKGILQGVHYLHITKKIIHRDLKPRNIMLMEGERDLSKVKIIDFGVACEETSDQMVDGRQAGTKIYQPPEFLYINEGTNQRHDQVSTPLFTLKIEIRYVGRRNHHVRAHRKEAPFLHQRHDGKRCYEQVEGFDQVGHGRQSSQRPPIGFSAPPSTFSAFVCKEKLKN